MVAPWRSWCRLCANPNGGVPIFNSDGSDRFLSEKIKKYLSISVSDEERVSCVLCSKCRDQLASFDNFVQHCLQVQAMFGALYELVDDNVADEQLNEIRKEFLHVDSESSKTKIVYGNNLPANYARKRSSEEGKENSPSKVRKEICSDRRQISPITKRKICEERIAQVTENNTIDCRKNGPLKEIAELRQAFNDENEMLADSLDSDFNEESFGNLLDSDDAFQPVLRNAANGFKIRDDDQSVQDLQVKQTHLIESSRGSELGKCPSENRSLENDHLSKRHEDLKLKNSNCINEFNCSVVSGGINGSCANSISDSDINNFMCDDDTDVEDSVQNVERGNGSDELRMNGTWKNPDKSKYEGPSKHIDSHHKSYELDDMFAESERELDCSKNNTWNVERVSEGSGQMKKRARVKEPATLKCDQCDKAFHRKAQLDAHAVSHVPKDQQPFVCCKCARRFHCESLLRNHERVHLPNEEKLVFPCDVCSKKFSSRSAVTAHVKAIHFGERPFVCHLCGHTFSSKGVLQEHLTIHSDEEPWHCGKCSKKFKTKYRLKIHMDTHRETPYTCPHCAMQLSTRRTLRMHLVVHRDTKAYQCATCGKAFRRAKDLKNHQNLHTGKRPYTCPFCSRTFANGSNCRSHKRRMHPEELRLYEAALAGNDSNDVINTSSPLETEAATNLIGRQELDDEGNQSMKEDSQDSLLTEMALDLQQPQMLSDKTVLTAVDDDPVPTAADLTLAPLVTLTSTLPKMEPDDSRFVMNLTTQMHDTHDSMEAMSPLNLNIMSPMNLNISSPLNLNISSPLNLNISSVLHSPTGRNQQHHSLQSQHHQNPGRYHQQAHHQPQQPQHLSLQPAQHQNHQQMQHQQLTPQPQVQQLHHQQVPRSSMQMPPLQTSCSVHTLPPQTQLPAHLNNTVHHTPQIQTFIPLNQQNTLYTHHTSQDSVSSAALVAAAAVAHSMSSSSSTTLPSFSSNVYVQHSLAYGRGANM